MFDTVIGLEIHIKLNSPNKLFCRCKNEQEFDDLTPNTHVCPTCMGQPGALPVLNQEPLEKAIQLGLALNCTVQLISQFDRKSYFYPDLPMGYQITQFSKPTNIDGSVTFFIDKEFSEERTVGIVDAHIETDTGKSIHSAGAVTLDYNRAGTPLVEIVTHPEFSTTQEVIGFLKHLQRVARFQDVGDGDMDKGQMRVDVNISLKPQGSEILGNRTETKNMSSFSAISRAIEYEVERQTEILNNGGVIDQQTRGWDDVAGSSFVMRSKEDAMDYRYFPEPDMPLVSISEQQLSKISQTMKPGPYERIKTYKDAYKFNKEYINALINDVDVNQAFEYGVAQGNPPAEVAKRLVGPIQRRLNEQQVGFDALAFTQKQFLDFLLLIKDGKLANAQAKIVMSEMIAHGTNPEQVIEEKGLKPVDEDQVKNRLDQIFKEKPDLLEDLKSGNMKPMGFVVGQVMKLSGGAADPGMVNGLIRKIIG